MHTALQSHTHPTEDQLATFSRDGFLVVRDAIPGELVERLLEASDRLMEADPGFDREDHDEFGIRGQPEPMLYDDAFLDLLAPPGVLPLVVAILSANVFVVGSELIYTEPQRPVRTPEDNLWHRDRKAGTADLGAAARLSLKAAYYLTDLSTPDAGMTLFAPGSHRLTEPLEIPPGRIDPAEVVRPEMGPGDAVLFEHRTWHCQGFNGSDRVRKAVFMEYGYRWLRRRMRTNAQLAEDRFEPLMEGRDPVERQLLGEVGPDADPTYAGGSGHGPIAEWCARTGVPFGPL